MILLIMLVLFGQVEDTLSIRFVETSGESRMIDGRMRSITFYDEEPGREPDTTWTWEDGAGVGLIQRTIIIDPDCGGAGILRDADGNPLPTYPRRENPESKQVPFIFKLMLTLIPVTLLSIGYWLGYRQGRKQ